MKGPGAAASCLERAGRLLSSLGLLEAPLRRVEHANVNDVFFCGDAVLRMTAMPNSDNALSREATLLRDLSGILPVPDVMAQGLFDDHEFLVLRRLEGEPLLFTWTGSNEAQKDASADRIVEWLRIMRSRKSVSFGMMGLQERQYVSWAGFCQAETALLLDQATGVNLCGKELAAEIARFVASQMETLGQQRVSSLVHNDLWPGNILARDGVAHSLLDFEFAVWGVPEMNLFMLECFCRCPEEFGHPGCYRDLWDRVMRRRDDSIDVLRMRREFDIYDLRFTLTNALFCAAVGEFPPAELARTRMRLESIVGGSVARLV